MTYVFTGTCACGTEHEKRVESLATVIPAGVDFVLVDCPCGRQAVLTLDALSRVVRDGEPPSL